MSSHEHSSFEHVPGRSDFDKSALHFPVQCSQTLHCTLEAERDTKITRRTIGPSEVRALLDQETNGRHVGQGYCESGTEDGPPGLLTAEAFR